jgi:hypothetical protein
MINPHFTVTVDDRHLMLHLDTLPKALKSAVRGRITSLMQQLLALVHAAEPRRTGILVRQTRGYVNERPDFIGGRVVILSRTADALEPHNVAAAALEYGVHGSGRGRKYRVRKSKVFNPLLATHPGPVRIPAHRFLRGPAATILPRARAEIEAAITEAIEQTQRS